MSVMSGSQKYAYIQPSRQGISIRHTVLTAALGGLAAPPRLNKEKSALMNVTVQDTRAYD